MSESWILMLCQICLSESLNLIVTTESGGNLRAFCDQVEGSFHSKRGYCKVYIKMRDDSRFHSQMGASELSYYYYKYNTDVYDRGQYRRLLRTFRQFDVLCSITKFFFHRISLSRLG